MDALLATYNHAHKYKKGEWGQVIKSVELLLTVRDMN